MKCLICNNMVSSIVDKRNNWEFFHCKECEFIFKHRACFVDATDELKQYNNHNNTIESRGYVEMFEKFINATFGSCLQEITNVLEFGSGPGPVLVSF